MKCKVVSSIFGVIEIESGFSDDDDGFLILFSFFLEAEGMFFMLEMWLE